MSPKIRIGINGFGRIGRMVLRAAMGVLGEVVQKVPLSKSLN